MSKLAIVGIMAGTKAYEKLSALPHFAPGLTYMYTDEDGDVFYACMWEWVDWTTFGQRAQEVEEVENALREIEKVHDEDAYDPKWAFKHLIVDECGESSAAFACGGEGLPIGIHYGISLPSASLQVKHEGG